MRKILPVYLVNCTPDLASAIEQSCSIFDGIVVRHFSSSREAAYVMIDESNGEQTPGIYVYSTNHSSYRTDIDLLRAIPGARILGVLSSSFAESCELDVEAVVRYPLQPDSFQTAFLKLTNYLSASQSGQIAIVTGMTTGVGATTMATHLSMTLANRNNKVILGDPTTLSSPIAKSLKPLSSPSPRAKTITGRRIEPSSFLLHEYSNTLSVISTERSDRIPSASHASKIHCLVESLRQLCSIAVLEVPCTYDSDYFSVLTAADWIIPVAEQRISSIRTTQMVLDRLQKLAFQGQLLVLCNRYDARHEGFDTNTLQRTLNVPTVHPIEYLESFSMRPISIESQELRIAAQFASIIDRFLALPQGDSSHNRVAELGSKEPRNSVDTNQDRLIEVLHIEDDPVQTLLLRHLLDQMGSYHFNVRSVPGEAEAINAFGDEIDLVVLDYQLTNGNGLSCLLRLKNMKPMIPVVVFSGTAGSKLTAELLSAGADDAFRKDDLNIQAFGVGIREALSRASVLRAC